MPLLATPWDSRARGPNTGSPTGRPGDKAHCPQTRGRYFRAKLAPAAGDGESPPSPRNPGKGGNEGKTGGEYRMRGKSQSPEWAQDLGEENMYKLTLM